MQLSRKNILPCLAIVFAMLLCVTDVMAQPGGGRGRQGGGGPGGQAGGGRGNISEALLRREDVQKELDLTEEQIELIEDMNNERDGDDFRKMMSELRDLPQEERMEKFREIRDQRAAESKKKLDDILLPFQIERLAQLSAQVSARGGSRSLINGSLAAQLEITEEQKEKLTEAAAKLQKELDEQVARLRREMQEKLIGELTEDQQAKFKELMGETFTFEQRQRDENGGGGVGGGRGGDRGGFGGGFGGGRGGDRGGRGENRSGGRGGDRGGGRGGDRGGDRGPDA